eukprot:g4361.t1
MLRNVQRHKLFLRSFSNMPEFVKIVEVGPRDGLQNEKFPVTTATKIELVNRLSDTGLSVIEAGSFVSAKAVPRMADSGDVLQGITRKANVNYPVLIVNGKGLDAALEAGVDEVAVFSSASDAFCRANTRQSMEEGLTGACDLTKAALDAGLQVRGYVSCVLGCPYEGNVDANSAVYAASRLHEEGCYEISLGDTIGVGTPIATRNLIRAIAKEVPVDKIAAHFHNTYGQALANTLAALGEGVSVVDSSVAGLGGCPYAKGATGNLATEELVYMLNGMGIRTNVDLEKLVSVGEFICEEIGRETDSLVAKAIANKRK